MYRYDEYDRALVVERVAQFRDQIGRYRAGRLTDEEFAPLRLQNGLYLQRHAYMLRVAIPYGVLAARQLRALADVAERFDRGYGHFTTRQNIQFNWLALDSVPDLLDTLAAVDLHAIQTSGNCIRNITCDPLAGVAADEIADPRPLAELLRQWSTFHPEFAFLPRKFKLALTGAKVDRAAVRFHDIGLRLQRDAQGTLGCQLLVGGGQGRTPAIGQVLDSFVPLTRLLSRLEAVLRVYNLHGRRDNKYKARIKILLKDLGLDAFRAAVDAAERPDAPDQAANVAAEYERLCTLFSAAAPVGSGPVTLPTASAAEPGSPLDFRSWLRHNVHPHRLPDHAAVTITLKGVGQAPGDLDATRMRAVADLVERFSCGECRVTHAQNLVLPYVATAQLPALWRALTALELQAADQGLASDVIACPGLDYCSLANARSIPLAQSLVQHFQDPVDVDDIGPLSIRISGCMNACGHHHAANIGILGVEKGGREFFQLTVGGESGDGAAIGERLGPAVTEDEAVQTVARLVQHYRAEREPGETFIATVRRLGVSSFREGCRDARC